MIQNKFLEDLIAKPNTISALEFEKIKEIVNKATEIAKDENRLIEINTPKKEKIFVFGDIHGNLHSLESILKEIKREKPQYIISLGDIVDRGSYQLQSLIIMCAFKILNPETFFILRGNHETLEMNRSYGFYSNFLSRFGDADKFDVILDFYNALPYCTLVNEAILCVHGGIPKNMDILKQLKKLKTEEINEIDLKAVDKSLFQMMWNDPKEEVNHFQPSYRGSDIFFFGEDALDEFMDGNNLETIIRAHEVFPEGYRWFFGKKLITLFSAENYRPTVANPAVYAIIQNETQIRVKALEKDF
ncbi:MAG: metallophosphoesterase [Promethearchaeia archaeon]